MQLRASGNFKKSVLIRTPAGKVDCAQKSDCTLTDTDEILFEFASFYRELYAFNKTGRVQIKTC